MPRLPLDVVYTVLDHISDSRDLHATTLVSWDFNTVATPHLYRTLDADIRTRRSDAHETTVILHPAKTLLKRPELARHVRHVRETGFVHSRNPALTAVALAALTLCHKLTSFTWSDDDSTSPSVFESFLEVLRQAPLRELTIRTYHDLGRHTWGKLNTLSGLNRVAVWCLEGPPPVLQGWAGLLGATLTELDLGRCSGVPATILISVLSQLPGLRSLRMKGAPSASMPELLACVPRLHTLDAEYLGAGLLRPVVRDTHDAPFPRLERLIVHASSIDLHGPQQLWAWLRQLVPQASLVALVLNTFSTQGTMRIPRHFLLALAHTHGTTLRMFLVGNTELTLEDVQCVCTLFPALEELSCAVTSPDVESIQHVTAKAQYLRALTLEVSWLPRDDRSSVGFSKHDAEAFMLREGSLVRTLAVGARVYTGVWAPCKDAQGKPSVELVVEEDLVDERGAR